MSPKKGAEVQLGDANPGGKASPWFLEVPGLVLGQFYPKAFYPYTIFNLSDFFAAPVPHRDLVSAPHMIITKYFNLFFTFLVLYVRTDLQELSCYHLVPSRRGAATAHRRGQLGHGSSLGSHGANPRPPRSARGHPAGTGAEKRCCGSTSLPFYKKNNIFWHKLPLVTGLSPGP